ncbi:MAG TPA: ISKra4 family transposase [Candidatus Acidoferrum sp.]|jgi:ribosomal protein S27AE|nr:ISKra4 family transposase [Candidatus Acidoferrum sp.]
MAQRRLSRPEPVEPPARPHLADQPSRFILLEREVELEYRPQMLAALQRKLNTVAEEIRAQTPECPRCGRTMSYHDARPVTWLAHWGRLNASPARYRCSRCQQERRPLLDLLGVEPGRICGSLARRLGLLAAVAPYELAARLAHLLLGVTISAMGVWRVAQRLGQAAAGYSEALSQYHADSRSEGASTEKAPPAVVLGVDGCTLGMQIRTHRRPRIGAEPLPPLPVIEQGHFREVKTGVLLLPSERVETSPGRRSVVRRFLVTCLGEADDIFRRLYAQLRELGWVAPHTVVVIVGDGAEWIWNRATMFVQRCEILDFWHALEHAWTFARLRYGEGSAQADRWVHQIAEDLRAGQVQDVITALKRLRPKSEELRESLQSLISYYSENAGRMRYDEYLRLGYGIGSGAVESAHKQVVHARLRQAGMRWSEAGARRLLALRLLLLNGDWALLDRLRMASLV